MCPVAELDSHWEWRSCPHRRPGEYSYKHSTQASGQYPWAPTPQVATPCIIHVQWKDCPIGEHIKAKGHIRNQALEITDLFISHGSHAHTPCSPPQGPEGLQFFLAHSEITWFHSRIPWGTSSISTSAELWAPWKVKEQKRVKLLYSQGSIAQQNTNPEHCYTEACRILYHRNSCFAPKVGNRSIS